MNVAGCLLYNYCAYDKTLSFKRIDRKELTNIGHTTDSFCCILFCVLHHITAVIVSFDFKKY